MKRGENNMVLHREIIRCFRYNPETVTYRCEQAYNTEIDDLSRLGIFLDAYNVKEVRHTTRTYYNGFVVITVFRDLFPYSGRNVKPETPMNNT